MTNTAIQSLHQVFITNAQGELEPFDPGKLELSLERAGAGSVARAKITAEILEHVTLGMTSQSIYEKAFQMLHSEDAPVAARYSIKRAVFALGPSGFPFEQFFAEVLTAHGWHTTTNRILQGRCTEHEVDVCASKGGKRVGIEAKFHNNGGGITDVQTALYVYARYEDLKRTPHQDSKVDEGWLVTNTRFTKNAIAYGSCIGLTMIGWDYPNRNGLCNMIEEARVHPLTCLTTLTESEKHAMLEKKVVLCKNIMSADVLREMGIHGDKIPHVLDEASRLCG